MVLCKCEALVVELSTSPPPSRLALKNCISSGCSFYFL